LATHDATGTEVVIRYFPDEWHRNPELRRYLRRQIREVSALRSSYLLRVREFVEDPEVSAVVCEAVRGAPLDALLAEHGPVPPEAALYLLRGSLCGLAAAHAAGVPHGGYRAQAVLVALDGQIKLMDFGFAPTGRYVADQVPPSATADVYAAIVAFVEFLSGDVAPADAVAATPAPLRGLVRLGMAGAVGAVGLRAALDEAAVAEYGSGWAERGRVWLALRVEELRADDARDRNRRDSLAAVEPAGLTWHGGVQRGEELRLAALRLDELRARAARTEELRLAALLARAAWQPEQRLPAQRRPIGADEPGGAPLARPAAAPPASTTPEVPSGATASFPGEDILERRRRRRTDRTTGDAPAPYEFPRFAGPVPPVSPPGMGALGWTGDRVSPPSDPAADDPVAAEEIIGGYPEQGAGQPDGWLILAVVAGVLICATLVVYWLVGRG
jgi:serine/threonine-protein kinase